MLTLSNYTLTDEYAERVYAGVLGKIIGVYLGRPFEGWPYEKLTERFTQVDYYVHEQLGQPLVVTDDDISGTFTFLRALEDYGYDPDITPAQIGQTWLNYIIENRTILWWGGMGRSTEHTAYLRLKHGTRAPESGSIARNSKVVAEQIGAQIFIDGWGMVCPGDPERAADLARRAASVSHDGEAIYGAQIVAAMEAQAFVEPDIDTLIETAIAFIPKDSVIYRLIADIREWHAAEPEEWRATRARIAFNYGYDKFGGDCHMVPNHALIIHALLHGGGDFQKSLMIVNTCGWDTDCNSGNVGCLLGVRGGLTAIDAGADFRGPVADRIYLPTADGGRAVTDALRETQFVINAARGLRGQSSLMWKDGARFSFALPGSVQGFRLEDSALARDTATVANEDGRLAIRYHALAPGRAARVATPTFTPDALHISNYALVASPTLYPGQTMRARVIADGGNASPVTVRLYLRRYGGDDQLADLPGPDVTLAAGQDEVLTWTIPPTGGQPIAEVGVEVTSETRADGRVTLDYLTWDGAPDVPFDAASGTAAKNAWVNGVDHFDFGAEFGLGNDEGRGLIIQGTREWTDYTVSATVSPHLGTAQGIAARVQGMRRYYALFLTDYGTAQLVKVLDGERTLAETEFEWVQDAPYRLSVTVSGNQIRAAVDGVALFDVRDDERPLTGGGIGLVIETGWMNVKDIGVQPV